MLAVIQTGGKQYKVKVGDKVKVEKIEAKEGDAVTFDQVLLVSKDEKNAEIGKPFLEVKKVEGLI